ncbi:MAG: glycerophosphodiester phosphodiesterase [candidate division NC10 bacterium]|nr:glycerophosphodiester phosphodiesterase [candidate division NC10 bacterium]
MVAPAGRPQDRVAVVGHRGACAHAPENTFRSFATGIAIGCQRVEMDMRPSKDPICDLVTLARDRGHRLISPRSGMTSPELIARAHAAGLQVYVYHVNTADAAADAIRFRADAIGTDYPDLVFRQLGAESPGIDGPPRVRWF